MKTERQYRQYPIIGTMESIPWDMLTPHEAQAERNHGGQTLERLAQRGGLCWRETLAVLRDEKWDKVSKLSEDEAKRIVLEHVAAWEAEQEKGGGDR